MVHLGTVGQMRTRMRGVRIFILMLRLNCKNKKQK